MEQGFINWYKLLSGFLCVMFALSLLFASFTCDDVNFNDITQTFWVTVTCGIYGLLSLVAFALSTFVAFIGLYADTGSKGRDALFFKLILLVNLTGAAGMVYYAVR
ncbi:MAG: hypothetical protein U1C57_02490 [Candidatus Doudnabacteria bacterium]|nr:hypothetical protein [Candidatus Doudnabacteria bacterium]